MALAAKEQRWTCGGFDSLPKSLSRAAGQPAEWSWDGIGNGAKGRGVRSIPEKTLEHWTSIYLSNRFPNGSFWWPAFGEDVLVELPRLAASGAGETFALELKTTEAVGTDHLLSIDTLQLDRYVNPPFGPPPPVYYVFPVPHWAGPLTSRSGMTPVAPTSTTLAPPAWWRRRAGRPWFGDWLYVLSAQDVAEALPGTRRSPSRTGERLFRLTPADMTGRGPNWRALLGWSSHVEPIRWRDFWKTTRLREPRGGVQWLTLADSAGRTDRVVVTEYGEQSVWEIGSLLNLRYDQRRRRIGRIGGEEIEEDGIERVMLHIPAPARG